MVGDPASEGYSQRNASVVLDDFSQIAPRVCTDQVSRGGTHAGTRNKLLVRSDLNRYMRYIFGKREADAAVFQEHAISAQPTPTRMFRIPSKLHYDV